MAVRKRNSQSPIVSHTPDNRGQAILSAVIKEHLITGEPVGSKIISEKFANTSGLSSATIRNVMGELEEAGLVEQPHISAGRIPTDKGYRFYVDNLLGVLSISKEDLDLINKELGVSELDLPETPEKLLEKTSQLLSVLSNNVGIVVLPSPAYNQLQHIEFVNLADKKILVVLVTKPDIVFNKIIRLEETLTQDELDRTSRYLNTEFAGKTLLEIRTQILLLMHEEKALFDKLLQTAVILCSQSIDGDSAVGDIYVDGTSNIIAKRDFSNIENLRNLLRTIEEKSKLVKILNECVSAETSIGNVQVVIGGENSADSLQNCTLITTPYQIGNNSVAGTLSVLGPTRIEYARMISIVSYIAKILEKLICENKSNNL